MRASFFCLALLCLGVGLVGAQDTDIDPEFMEEDDTSAESAVICPLSYTWENGKCSPDDADVEQPICPGDFVWDGRLCKKIVTVCPIGYVNNTETGVCEQGAGLDIGPIACPAGYRYDMQRNRCYPLNPCPGGFDFKDGKCVLYTVGSDNETYVEPGCPVSYEYNIRTGRCEKQIVDNLDPTCYRGRLINGVCVYQQIEQPTCPFGSSLENGRCVKKRYVAATSCPSGFELNGTVCVDVQQISAFCPYNTELRDNQCVRLESTRPTCDDGYFFRNGRCESYQRIEPICEPDHELINGRCVRIVVAEPECPLGYEYDRGTCVKDVVIPLECPRGYIMQENQMCLIMETRIPSCPDDAQLDGRYCIYIEYINYTCPVDYLLVDGICERLVTELPRCPAEYQLNLNGECEKIFVYYPPAPPVPTVVAPPPLITCPTVGPVPPCPGCPEQKCQTSSTCGSSCPVVSAPQIVMPPINNYVYNNNTVHAPVNVTSLNTNTITITTTPNCKRGYRTVQSQQGSQVLVHQECIEDEEKKAEKIQEVAEVEESKPVEPESKPKCCTIVGPQECQRRSSLYSCFRRRHQRCGAMCSKGTVYLRPRPSQGYRHNMFMMPAYYPMRQYQAYYSARQEAPQHFDCERCIRSYARCPAHCYEYDCEGESCEYDDEEDYED